MNDVQIHARAEWILVGERATESLLVKGGEKPIAIRVSHPDTMHLLELLSEANAGIRSQEGRND